MQRLYGFKEQDVIMLADFLNERKTSSLSSVFSEFGSKHNKAKGTVRNLYYAVAKKSREDEEFCKQYFNGVPLTVGKITEFTECQTIALLKQIIAKKLQGKSVRRAIFELSGGDSVLALRFQNKYRNECIKNPELIEKLTAEISAKKGVQYSASIHKKQTKNENGENINRLKSEINGLFERAQAKLLDENGKLRNRIVLLERENAKLLNLLYGEGSAKKALKIFHKTHPDSVLN